MDNSENNITAADQKRSLWLAVLILLLMLPFANYFDGFWRHFLGFPSAQICSIFLGSDCIATPEGYMLTNEMLPVHVTKACSAASFFMLLLVLISGAVIKSLQIKEFLKITWIIPLAYIITISANAARIVGGWITGRWARMVLPENFWAGIHLGTGVVVFLTFLIATYLLLKWRPLYGYQGNKASDS
jgi:exosortase K